MSKEVLTALDQIETEINELVTTIETLKGYETDEINHQEDMKSVKSKFDQGLISKSSFDKITDKAHAKLEELKTHKKQNWDGLILSLNKITDLLGKVKQEYK